MTAICIILAVASVLMCAVIIGATHLHKHDADFRQ